MLWVQAAWKRQRHNKLHKPHKRLLTGSNLLLQPNHWAWPLWNPFLYAHSDVTKDWQKKRGGGKSLRIGLPSSKTLHNTDGDKYQRVNNDFSRCSIILAGLTRPARTLFWNKNKAPQILEFQESVNTRVYPLLPNKLQSSFRIVGLRLMLERIYKV